MPEEVHWIGAGRFYGEKPWVMAERYYGLKRGALARFPEHWLIWASIWGLAESRYHELQQPTTTTYR